MVCREGFGEFFKKIKLVDEYYEVIKGQRNSYRKVSRDLSFLQFKLVFCPHQSFRSAILVYSLKSEKKVGFKEWWNFSVFHKRISRNTNLPEALRQLSLLWEEDEGLKQKLIHYAQENPIENLGPVPDWCSMDVSNRLRDELPSIHLLDELENKREFRGVIALFPGSVWPTKQWKISGFKKLAGRLVSKNYKVFLMGGKSERAFAEKIAQGHSEVYNLVGRTNLFDSLLILKRCSFVVSNDSGGQHLASAVGVPTISIFGPTVLSFGYRPWNARSSVVEVPNLSCRPCGRHGHRQCPLGTHECMEKISPEKVIYAMEELGLNND